jgi:hypothetical protein
MKTVTKMKTKKSNAKTKAMEASNSQAFSTASCTVLVDCVQHRRRFDLLLWTTQQAE